MFMVYWCNVHHDDTLKSCSQRFELDQMKDAMTFMEDLRRQQREGGNGVCFITMCSENPNSVGNPGVDETGPDYNWTKRRGNMPGLKK